MKKALLCSTFALGMLGLFALPAHAGKPADGHKGNGAPKGKFEKFLLVAPGNPNTEQADLDSFLGGNAESSGGKAIFIPIKTTVSPNSTYCDAADGSGVDLINDTANGNLVSAEPTQGVKINFVKNPDISKLIVVDRDATDGYAEVDVPDSWATATSVDLYMRVLGKPGGCIEADAYVYDNSYWYYAGTVTFKRKKGQSTFVDAGDLTDVYYCPAGTFAVNITGNSYDCCVDLACTGGSVPAENTNVFSTLFNEYFWQVTNDGVRVAQVLMRANF